MARLDVLRRFAAGLFETAAEAGRSDGSSKLGNGDKGFVRLVLD